MQWQEPHSQHDAADFLLRLHEVMQAPQFESFWQAYTQSPLALRDEGGTCPTALTAVGNLSGVNNLQSLIHVWHKQRAQHAFVRGTQCVALQVNRFELTEGVISKNRRRLSCSDHLLLPIWDDSGVVWQTFKLSAMIVHLGSVPTQGHYQSVLYRDGRVWLTDDGRTPSSSVEHFAPRILDSCYIVFYVKASHWL